MNNLEHSFKQNYITLFEKNKTKLPGWCFPWVDELRNQNLNFFFENDLPHTNDEEWKYTSLSELIKQTWVWPSATENTISLEIMSILDELSKLSDNKLVFIDGQFYEQLSSIVNLPKGVHLIDLAYGLNNQASLVQNFFKDYSSNHHSVFDSINTALMSNGFLLKLEQNTVVKNPIQLIFISSQQSVSSALHLKNLIHLEANSQANIVEIYIGLNQVNSFTNTVTEITLDKNSQLRHCRLQQEATNAYHIGSCRVNQAQDSYYVSDVFSFGASLSRYNLDVNLESVGANCQLNGLYLTKDRQHHDHHLCVTHLKPQTYSYQDYKGILNDFSRAVFNSRVVIKKDAQRSISKQLNKNIMLSPSVEIDTKPELQIYADDVKCSHGTTVGQLDKESLFYLCSRGLAKELANNLLTYGFVKEVIDRIPHNPTHNYITKNLFNELSQSKLIGEFLC